MKLAFYSRKLNEVSECISFYREIVDSFEAMRKNPTRGVQRSDVTLM